MSGSHEVAVLRRPDEVSQIADDWNRLIQGALFSLPSFESVQQLSQDFEGRFLLLAQRVDGQVTAIACFYCIQGHKAYKAGERMLFRLPVRDVRLYGGAMPGSVDDELVDRFLTIVTREFSFDVLTIGETPIASPLYAAVMAQTKRFLVAELSRKRSLRWMIRMPKDFDSYMLTLGAKSRQNVRREIRMFEKQFKCEFQSVRRTDQIEPFLASAEAISRKTYQWNVGQRIVNDEASQHGLMRLAQRGELYCYIVHADANPVAFMRGRLVGGTYEFETAGFDPAYSKASPGAVLLMFAVRDLIENAHCVNFDFGQGGDEVGYKARFGNESHACALLQLGRKSNVYTLFLFAVQKLLLGSLNLADRLLGDGKLRARIKKGLRKYGDR